jgi:peptidoglycan hydrolase CwlO-like protein
MEAALQTDKAELQTVVDELADDREALLQEKAELQATKDALIESVRWVGDTRVRL